MLGFLLNTQNSMMKMDLLPNIHLLTFELLESNVFLLRLDHQFAASDYERNKPVNISLSVSYIIDTCTCI